MNPDEARMLVEALDAFPGALIVVDARGQVLFSNTRAAIWDGDPPRIRVGQPLPEGFPGWMDAPGAAEVRQAVTDRAPLRMVEASPRVEARLETAIVPAADSLLIWVREVGSSGAEALEADERRKLAHDLMQPLGTIMNYAALIAGQSDGEVLRWAREIERIAAAMGPSTRERLGVG
jgi:hypothetical protein